MAKAEQIAKQRAAIPYAAIEGALLPRPSADCTGRELSGYPNGRLPSAALCPLWGTNGHMLRADAAAAFNAMSHAYAERFGAPICVTDSYRTYDEQVAVKAAKPDLAATPGTSNHGWAVAVDLCDGVQSFGTATHDWLRRNSLRFGGSCRPGPCPAAASPSRGTGSSRGRAPARRHPRAGPAAARPARPSATAPAPTPDRRPQRSGASRVLQQSGDGVDDLGLGRPVDDVTGAPLQHGVRCSPGAPGDHGQPGGRRLEVDDPEPLHLEPAPRVRHGIANTSPAACARALLPRHRAR
jgi:hypothetical protein